MEFFQSRGHLGLVMAYITVFSVVILSGCASGPSGPSRVVIYGGEEDIERSLALSMSLQQKAIITRSNETKLVSIDGKSPTPLIVTTTSPYPQLLDLLRKDRTLRDDVVDVEVKLFVLDPGRHAFEVGYKGEMWNPRVWRYTTYESVGNQTVTVTLEAGKVYRIYASSTRTARDILLETNPFYYGGEWDVGIFVCDNLNNKRPVPIEGRSGYPVGR